MKMTNAEKIVRYSDYGNCCGRRRGLSWLRLSLLGRIFAGGIGGDWDGAGGFDRFGHWNW
jgi:hypothetical protein